ncbi:LmeA family phospholipid-binding protein [Rhodococcus sp. X156]|uniref:LmeA family phospholipid-binding protein n=1 Tax=Rhodococcus sp. X156 TaxID=2499145 RepID=UPI000FDABA4D|nr:LmeA family phospholipid-binding protein [Rhodococcus sp. X156]
MEDGPVRTFVFSLIGVLLVAVLADYGTAAYAEYRVSKELREELTLNSDPEVRITGFPFLTQAAQGSFSQVNVRAVGVPMADLGNVTVEATLRGAKVPASSVFGGNLDDIVVSELNSRIRINETRLGQLIGISDLKVSAPVADPTLGTSGGDAYKVPQSGIVLTGTVKLGGVVKQQVSVNADLVLDGQQVRIIATGFAMAGQSSKTLTLAAPLSEIAMQKFSLTLDSDYLPFGVTPTTVHAEGADIVVEGKGTDVRLARLSRS